MQVSRTRLFGPRPLWWEKAGLTSPALMVIGSRIHMLYRAQGEDGISRLGLAVSDDGENFVKLDDPTVESAEQNSLERLGLSDPRATAIGKEVFITYTALSTLPPSERAQTTSHWPKRSRTIITRSRDFKNLEPVSVPFPSLNTGPAVLLPAKLQNRYWLLYTLDGAIYLSYSTNFKNWEGGLQLIAAKEKWEKNGLAVACPPVETERGWLMFYNTDHGVGLALLDRSNPAVILKRLSTPLVSAVESWEKPAINLSGSLSLRGNLWLYYGGREIGLMKISLEELLKKIDES